MPTLTLYHGPFGCSKVTLNVLAASGLEYQLRIVDLLRGGQKTADYRAINPKGKVPALLVDAELLTENGAILPYLNELAPNAGLLPQATTPLERARIYKEVVWCSATLHPMVRQIRAPMRYTDGDTEGIRAKGTELFSETVADINARLTLNPWWFGESWSIVDVYLHWCYAAAGLGGFDLNPYPSVLEHGKRVQGQASYQSALSRERAAVEAAGVRLPDGVELT